MAILLVKIEDTASLSLNEFFDYNGVCYALSRSRSGNGETCIDLQDFWEATVETEKLTDVPVVFVAGEGSSGNTAGKTARKPGEQPGGEGAGCILGWYRKADIYRTMRHPSFFLEGNILAEGADVIRLPQENGLPQPLHRITWQNMAGAYEVVEMEDQRYDELIRMILEYKGANAFTRYPYIRIRPDRSQIRDYEHCIRACEVLARRIMEDDCQGLPEIKSLELIAREAIRCNSKDADGYYYLSMACYQMGQVKEGLKAIGKALEREPGSPDLLAQKANLLASKGYYEAAAEHFHQAYAAAGEEDYLLMEGKTWLLSGQVDKAYDVFKTITDKEILENAGIHLKEIERKWPFVNIRGFRLGRIFRKK